MTLAEPTSTDDLRALLLDFLDYYRDSIAAKLSALPEDQLRSSQLPSGWTPAGLLTHLAYMERRWFRWGFLAEQVDAPFGDRDGSGWVNSSGDAATLIAKLHDAGRRTREIVEAHELNERSAVGGRFQTESDAPLLQWILLHVLQEYARHTGHLDIVTELAVKGG